ncbi:DUF5004 domain-containing protein [Aequorivita echinoideorum]|uniref:DUF5004 domain-containing protein n=1 Tax=Aequorivita echinoideorum TaxID=1549647 RepID=A0ABS5S0P0_9FLAO|nr:DUF5004 domain-containing protein [Aequorivita echinoideorum]MBT0606778.1 DUF5004 domain-containing protein [Aequorivita echinoideorum]
MKKLYVLFAFILITVAANSQSISEKELMGVWQVTSVTSASQNPNQAQLIAGLQRATMYFKNDHTFEFNSYSTNPTLASFIENTQNSQWKYDANLQTVAIGTAENNYSAMIIKVRKQNGKVSFLLQETNVELQVIKPE